MYNRVTNFFKLNILAYKQFVFRKYLQMEKSLLGFMK
jgi:hypothetical protein